MKRRFELLGAGGVSLATVLALGAACGNDAEDRPSGETSPPADQSASPTASAAAEIIMGTIVDTQDSSGVEVGVYAYTSPLSSREINGNFGPGATVGFNCQREGDQGQDFNVPSSPEPVEWTTWNLVADEYNDTSDPQWVPAPFVDTVRPLPQCDPSLITP